MGDGEHANALMATTLGFVAKGQLAELVAASTEHEWRQTLPILLSFTDGAELTHLASRMVMDGAVSCLMCSHNVAELVTLWTNPVSKLTATELCVTWLSREQRTCPAHLLCLLYDELELDFGWLRHLMIKSFASLRSDRA